MAKAVAPKREALALAQAELASTQAILDEAKAKLDEVEQGIATLQEKYTQCKCEKRIFVFRVLIFLLSAKNLPALVFRFSFTN